MAEYTNKRKRGAIMTFHDVFSLMVPFLMAGPYIYIFTMQSRKQS